MMKPKAVSYTHLRTDRNANDHHKGVLNIGHISGQPCDDAGRGKLINIGK